MHDAVIQVRRESGLTQDEEKTIYSILSRYAREWELLQPKSGKGIDIYVSSVVLGRRIASKIAKAFKGEIKESTKYAGMQSGKKRYRFYVRVRL